MDSEATGKAKMWPLGDNWIASKAEKINNPKGGPKSEIVFLRTIPDPEVVQQIRRLLETTKGRMLMSHRHNIALHFECAGNDCIAIIAKNTLILEEAKIRLKKVVASRETHTGEAAEMVEEVGVAVALLASA